ncbi:hypothetical protein SAMN05216553_104108 [Lentzea fradiae]|uniref:Uncharacterized protein n=1 Tax=Lentzea fradiae TaxID=200378 RepID=A0A1G7PWI8_9PSEU|nr:hypothetical protein [Lentzea fradiae]SDF90575.1 hypothetical protein SAMN05216553_104108 [Lentzea fradiae]
MLLGHAYSGRTSFEIRTGPATSPWVTHAPRPKAPVVVPVGAPETGGGGTA